MSTSHFRTSATGKKRSGTHRSNQWNHLQWSCSMASTSVDFQHSSIMRVFVQAVGRRTCCLPMSFVFRCEPMRFFNSSNLGAWSAFVIISADMWEPSQYSVLKIPHLACNTTNLISRHGVLPSMKILRQTASILLDCPPSKASVSYDVSLSIRGILRCHSSLQPQQKTTPLWALLP